MLLEDPSSEERILSDWESLLPQTLQEWGVNGDHIAAFSDGYRNASLIRDRVRWSFLVAQVDWYAGAVHFSTHAHLTFYKCFAACLDVPESAVWRHI